MASSLTTRLLEQSRISPPPGSVSDSSVPLSFFDLLWLDAAPVHRLFFYASSDPAVPFVDSIKSSLSRTLQHFYVLAGTVRPPNKTNENKFEIHYKDGDSVLLTVVESDADFKDVACGWKRDFNTLIHPLVPQLCGLFSVQLTVFPRQGVCIGITVDHVAGDGSSIVRFLKTWASLCKSGEDVIAQVERPIYDRALISDNPVVYSTIFNRVIQSGDIFHTEQATPSIELSLGSFTLGGDQIERFKLRVRARGESSVHCSSFVVSCAYTWVCLVRTRGWTSDRIAHFGFAVDCRGRIDPPVPPSYFGNCLGPCFVQENVGVLIGSGGLVAASIAIGKAVERIKENVMRDFEDLEGKMSVVMKEEPLSVAGSPKLGVYDVDFGLGKPVRVEVPSIQSTGAMSLAEAREGVGGVEIGLALRRFEMDLFEKHFYGGLEFSNFSSSV